MFAILLTAAFNLQLLNIWLVAYPLGLRLADAKGVERARLSTSSIVLVAMLCAPISGMIGALLAAFGRADLIVPGIAWFALWQMQQATRRALFADLNHREAVVGDVLSSLGQVLMVSIVAAVGNLSLVFAVMFSPLLLSAFYGSGSPYLQLGHLFPPLAVFAAAMMATELITCYLLGIGEARLALKINLVGLAAVVILAGPLLASFGTLPGTCMTLAAADAIRLVAALVWLRRLIGSAG